MTNHEFTNSTYTSLTEQAFQGLTEFYENWLASQVMPEPEPVVETPAQTGCACGNPTCTMTAKTVRTPHGKYTRYTNHNCRCEPCVAAYREFRTKYRVVKPEVCGCGNTRCTRRTRREVKHGLSCYFRHKCRCDVCNSAMRAYQRDRRARLRAESATPMTLVEVFAQYGIGVAPESYPW
jgi:hypothetical protein